LNKEVMASLATEEQLVAANNTKFLSCAALMNQTGTSVRAIAISVSFR